MTDFMLENERTAREKRIADIATLRGELGQILLWVNLVRVLVLVDKTLYPAEQRVVGRYGHAHIVACTQKINNLF